MSRRRSETNIDGSQHNHNVFSFFEELFKSGTPDAIHALIPKPLLGKFEDAELDYDVDYDPDFPYADYYLKLISTIERNFDALYKHLEENARLRQFIIRLFENDNHALENTYDLIRSQTETTLPGESIEKGVKKVVKKDDAKTDASASPSHTGSKMQLGKAVVARDFYPQNYNIPTVRHYRYQSDRLTEFRYGTQGIRKKGKAGVHNNYRLYLRARRLERKEEGITHIYFNYMSLHRTDFEGKKETRMSQQLHSLENDNPNIAVITLPADRHFFARKDYQRREPSIPENTMINELVNYAFQSESSTKPGGKDFYMSPRVRNLIFPGGNDLAQKAMLDRLIRIAINDLNLQNKSVYSPAERQAIWFHFVKFTMTDYIFQKLKPKSFNMSCKDAIDRGGVSSAYYNLLSSFKSTSPMSREEFDRALHAAPAMVKGRGMNSHLNLIWNAVDAYVEANYDDIKTNESKAWLIEWRNANCPKARVDELLMKNVVRAQSEIGKMGDGNVHIKDASAILNEVHHLATSDVTDKEALIEVAALTPDLVKKNPAKHKVDRYNYLAKKIEVKQPKFKILSGLMKAFVATVSFLVTREMNRSMLNSGIASIRTGFLSGKRKALSSKVKALSDAKKTKK